MQLEHEKCLEIMFRSNAHIEPSLVRTDGRTDGRTYGRTYGNSPLCPTGHRPFGVAAQKQLCLQLVMEVRIFNSAPWNFAGQNRSFFAVCNFFQNWSIWSQSQMASFFSSKLAWYSLYHSVTLYHFFLSCSILRLRLNAFKVCYFQALWELRLTS